MTYSRTRLAAIAVVWIAAAALLGVPSGELSAVAQNTNCGTADDPLNGPPCMFPAEANIGGIVLGTSYLDGDDLTAFDGLSGADTAPNRVDFREEVIGLGLNAVAADDFFIYKSYKFDSTEDGQRRDAYIWASADTAQLSGTSTCGDGSGSEAVGRRTCDLFIETGEAAFGQIDAVGSTPFLLPDVDITAEDYWVIDPQDDTECDILDAVFNGGMCLGLIVDGTLSGDLADVSVEAYDVRIRGHNISAIEASDGTNKVLDLQNAYIETRYEKGQDRVIEQGVPPIDPFGENITRKAALSNDYRCEGNPTQSDPSCVIDSDRKGSTGVGDESYDDIHR